MRRFLLLLVAMATVPLGAQTEAAKTRAERKARYEAHKSDFDYLLGDWEFTAQSVEWGKYGGRWNAVRTAEGHILDEYRILDDKGGTIDVTSTVRSYNSAADRWGCGSQRTHPPRLTGKICRHDAAVFSTL